MRADRTRTTSTPAALLTAVGVLLAAAHALAEVPNPKVTGPIAWGAAPGDPSHDYTFFSSTAELAEHGYVEEEYFIEGTAHRYETKALATGTVLEGEYPYKTRVVVRRPVSRRDFNGTVLIEWLNVTAGYDIEAHWFGSYEHLMREGYVWIGVSAQRVGVHQPGTGLTSWSPARYGTLDVTAAGTLLDDSLSYDIFSQAAQAVRNPSGVNLLSGLRPRRFFAIGASQSASRLTVYYNSILPLTKSFDAFMLLVGGSAIRTDLGVPVFKIYSETDVPVVFPVLQADSDIHRTWQVAGASHSDYRFVSGVRPHATRDGLSLSPADGCGTPPFSQLRFYLVLNAVYEHLDRWVKWGIEPPTAQPLEIASAGPPALVSRDERGLALGGVRIADIEVPTALNAGTNSGPAFCRLYGTNVPFDQATLDTMYPSHQRYVREVAEVTRENVRDGYLTLRDALTIISDAARSSVGAQR